MATGESGGVVQPVRVSDCSAASVPAAEERVYVHVSNNSRSVEISIVCICDLLTNCSYGDTAMIAGVANGIAIGSFVVRHFDFPRIPLFWIKGVLVLLLLYGAFFSLIKVLVLVSL